MAVIQTHFTCYNKWLLHRCTWTTHTQTQNSKRGSLSNYCSVPLCSAWYWLDWYWVSPVNHLDNYNACCLVSDAQIKTRRKQETLSKNSTAKIKRYCGHIKIYTNTHLSQAGCTCQASAPRKHKLTHLLWVTSWKLSNWPWVIFFPLALSNLL